ncbi:MAG: hypothetical protein MHM6MM_001904 [Cercozoa sp. M6MM]
MGSVVFNDADFETTQSKADIEVEVDAPPSYNQAAGSGPVSSRPQPIPTNSIAAPAAHRIDAYVREGPTRFEQESHSRVQWSGDVQFGAFIRSDKDKWIFYYVVTTVLCFILMPVYAHVAAKQRDSYGSSSTMWKHVAALAGGLGAVLVIAGIALWAKYRTPTGEARGLFGLALITTAMVSATYGCLVANSTFDDSGSKYGKYIEGGIIGDPARPPAMVATGGMLLELGPDVNVDNTAVLYEQKREPVPGAKDGSSYITHYCVWPLRLRDSNDTATVMAVGGSLSSSGCSTKRAMWSGPAAGSYAATFPYSESRESLVDEVIPTFFSEFPQFRQTGEVAC